MSRGTRSSGASGRRRLLTAIVAGCATLLSASALAASGTVVFKTPPYPIFVAGGYGSIWVGTHHAYLLYRINPRTNKISKTIKLHHTPCGEATVGFGAIFIPDCTSEGGNTFEISAATNKLVRLISGESPIAGYGSLWLLNLAGTNVKRVDPKSGVVLSTIPTGLNDGAAGGAEVLGTAGAGSVWLESDLSQTVLRIDAATNKVSDVIPLPGAATHPAPSQGYAGGAQMASAGGKIWAGNPAGVYEIDPATNTATLLPIKIGNYSAWGDITFTTGLGSVWVRTSGNTVSRIDPATARVIATYPADGGGGGITIANGSLWTANAGTDTTWRQPIHGTN